MKPSSERRLAVVSDAVYPWNTGGKEVRHHELLTRLARQGFAVDVYTMHWWDGPERIHQVGGVTYHALCRRLPLYHGPRRSITQALVFALASLQMITRRFDVLEVDAIPFLHLFPMRVVAWLRRAPMVVTWHEFWGQDYWLAYLGPAGRLAALLERTAVRVPDRLVAASEGTGRRLLDQVSAPLDLTVVPNGITTTDTSELPTPVDPTELIAVGRLLENKKLDVALGATRVLRDRGLNVRLRIIGEGPEDESLRRLADRLDVGDSVVFTGFLPDRRDVMALMAVARVLVFPSVREGFGMVALESLSLGTPVVTSDHADNFARHLITAGVNGEVCPAEEISVADAIERVMKAGESMRAAARASATAYDWDPLSRRLGEVYAR